MYASSTATSTVTVTVYDMLLCRATVDGNGNIMALVSEANGEIFTQYEYGPFGEILKADGDLAQANPFRFSTKYHDENGLAYYGYRYYDAEVGRWLSRDPIGERGGANLYGFVGNAPVGRIDVLGMKESDGNVRRCTADLFIGHNLQITKAVDKLGDKFCCAYVAGVGCKGSKDDSDINDTLKTRGKPVVPNVPELPQLMVRTRKPAGWGVVTEQTLSKVASRGAIMAMIEEDVGHGFGKPAHITAEQWDPQDTPGWQRYRWVMEGFIRELKNSAKLICEGDCECETATLTIHFLKQKEITLKNLQKDLGKEVFKGGTVENRVFAKDTVTWVVDCAKYKKDQKTK